MDKDIPQEFWDLLGGKGTISADDGGDEDWEKEGEAQMFQLSDAGGKLEFVSVASGKNVNLSKLDTNDVFIIDVNSSIYVWIGNGSSMTERSSGMSQAQTYLEEYKRPSWLPITRIIEGSENDYFISAMTPKTTRKFKKSTGGPSVEQKGEMGCYLTLTSSSNGSMFLNWSHTKVDGSVAYFKPTKSVPAFKFKTKGGKSELTRGTDNSAKNLYTGWVNYCKLCKEYKGTFVLKATDTAIWTLTGSKPFRIPQGEPVDLTTVETVAAVPGKASDSVFGGLKTISKGTFINKAQEKGAALTLPK